MSQETHVINGTRTERYFMADFENIRETLLTTAFLPIQIVKRLRDSETCRVRIINIFVIIIVIPCAGSSWKSCNSVALQTPDYHEK